MTDSTDHAPGATHLPEFARRYDIGMTTAYELARTGQLRVVRIGRKPVVLAEDEAAWRASLPEWTPTAPTDHRRKNGKRVTRRRRKRPTPPSSPDAS